MEFTCVEKTVDSVTHRLVATEATKEIYPYDFELLATHYLDKENPRLLHVAWELKNHSEEQMYYSLGGSIGNTAIYEHDEPVIAQRSIAIFGSLINNRYMKLLLDSPLFQQQFTSKSNGTAQGGIYLGELANMLVPLPPEDEQNRILTCVSILENCLASM